MKLAVLETAFRWLPIRPYFWISILTAIACSLLSHLVVAARVVVSGVCKMLYDITKIVEPLILNHRKKENLRSTMYKFQSLWHTVDGCEGFETWYQVVGYGLHRLVGSVLCDRLRWYRSITFTRYVVYYPIKYLVWQPVHGDCTPTYEDDVCFGFHFDLVFDFVRKYLILTIVVLINCWPLVSYALSVFRRAVKSVHREMVYQLHRLDPGNRSVKHGRLTKRLKHFFHVD